MWKEKALNQLWKWLNQRKNYDFALNMQLKLGGWSGQTIVATISYRGKFLYNRIFGVNT